MGETNIPHKERIAPREWLVKRRQQCLREHGPCALCGFWESLQLHHKHSSEKKLHKSWSWAKDRLEVELQKCIILYERCHTIYHAVEKRKPLAHGTLHAYETHKCGCGPRRAAKAEYRKQWEARK